MFRFRSTKLLTLLFVFGCGGTEQSDDVDVEWGASACEQHMREICACEGELAEAACEAAQAALENEVTKEMEEACEEAEIDCRVFEAAEGATE